MTSITIPNSVTSIGKEAFSDCDGLTSVTIPNSVTYIGDYAFNNCRGLTSVHITDLKAWCKINFSNYPGSNPLYHARHLYMNGEEITNLIIPDSVTNIRSRAFCGCDGLTSITIPNSVTSIGEEAFSDCDGLTSVIIPNSVTSIRSRAFCDCDGLTSVTIEGSLNSIESRIFDSCDTLTFYLNCRQIEIEFAQLFGGIEVVKVVIGENVRNLGADPFAECEDLTTVVCRTKKVLAWFTGATSIEELVIGENVVGVVEGALKDCTGLKTITLKTSTPPTVGDGNFTENQYANIIVRVPEGSLAAYQAAEGWKEFWDIIEYKYVPDGIRPIVPSCNAIDAAPIYNLQGVRMKEGKENLPAGIYIQGGKKMIVR